MKFKVGDQVKVIKSIDPAAPVEPRFMGEEGEIVGIDSKGNIGMIFVEFGEVGEDGFWPEELKLIKNMAKSKS